VSVAETARVEAPVVFEELLAEAESTPVSGWDFSWFDGRATEERPSWGYAASLAVRLGGAEAVVDLQTGGGEVFAEALAGCRRRPRSLTATESWPPNLELARERLGRFDVRVEDVPEPGPLPFGSGSFDLVVSRHPTVVPWTEIARVLRPWGTFFAQLVGAGSNRELTEFLMGPRPVGDFRSPERALADARAAGLDVVDLRDETLRVVFDDVGAVAYFLRKVPWTVPDFTVEGYRSELLRLHRCIERDGAFVSHSRRLLVEARRLEGDRELKDL
jgi:SAM-dependent methyltransferase